MIKEIIKTQTGVIHTKKMHVQRAPAEHTCKCGERTVLILPKADGTNIWLCGGCKKQKHRVQYYRDSPNMTFAMEI